MNIDAFLSYRDECLVCNEKLNLNFISLQSNKKIRFIDDYIQAEYTINDFPAAKGKTQFTVQLHLHRYDNTYYVEFLDSKRDIMKCVPISRFEDYKSFIANKGARLIKSCPCCRKGIASSYTYSASLKFQNNNINPLAIHMEQCEFTHPVSVDKKYRITSFPEDNRSRIDCVLYKQGRTSTSTLELPFVPITSVDKMTSKIDMLFTFS